jgi:hypothetical protein
MMENNVVDTSDFMINRIRRSMTYPDKEWRKYDRFNIC